VSISTLGEPWEEEVERADIKAIMSRAEPYPLRTCPPGVLVLCAFVDIQGDRFEAVVWGFGRDCEAWVIDYQVQYDVNPFIDSDWDVIDDLLEKRYPHAEGGDLGIEIAGIDSGYATHHAYRFCRVRERQRVYATKGETRDNRPIKSRRTLVDVRQRTGRPIKNGCKLHFIGTDAAKDLILGRLLVDMPGPGYMHFSSQLPAVFFDQLTSEVRVQQRVSGQFAYRWVKPNSSVRNEVLDCTVGALWGLEMLIERYRGEDRLWLEMERRLSNQMPHQSARPAEQAPPPAPRPAPPNVPRGTGIGRSDWVL
jgi:phage terminase large subunit GpA-like protein